MTDGPLAYAHPALRTWFSETFAGPTRAQELAWPAISRGESTLLLAPTGSGKTLAAFLVALNRLVFTPRESLGTSTRVLYISPLKALGVDVERNLRVPLGGLCAVARRDGFEFTEPRVGVRSGDTSREERVRLAKAPPDILITTPESLYLLLTSRARETLRRIDTVIIDEIHSLSATKRGAHLMLSLERLEASSQLPRPLQRIGLSATQRPLAEIAQLLGGFSIDEHGAPAPRPVTIIDAGRTKRFELRVEVTVEDMTAPVASTPTGERPAGPPSIWPALFPRVLELIRAHHSTLLFVNSRRLAERVAQSLNELADKEVALAHHGSIAKDTRQTIEDRLKRGTIPAIVATSSLELGIDMGAVDLVIHIEAPPSVASGMQRIGRSGHQVDAPSRGVLFPKHRGDLLPCAAMVGHTQAGEVEATHYPRNPLDVLAQQIVSVLVEAPCTTDALFALVRGAAPFAELPRPLFESVLDMLSGRYPSERFRELRPRISWDRTTGRLQARRSARLLAVANPGTIVDRGLYGVYVAGTTPPVRVGELDEEMVFETRPGEVFLLGASSWRVEEISHDRVLVSPAPGEPGKMPFWHGDRPGRPLEFGIAIGVLTRELAALGNEEASAELQRRYGLNQLAALNLMAYLRDQQARSFVPTDRQIVIETFADDLGEWRVVVLSPFGGRIHAPWSIVVAAGLREELGIEVDTLWTDDGMVFRLPDCGEPPELTSVLPAVDRAEACLRDSLQGTALFAAHFRENAARALLLPRRKPGRRLPLWMQRRRSSDLLRAASEYGDFPIVLETYRECLQDVFDLAGLKQVLAGVHEGTIAARWVRPALASPFAATVLFSYVGNFMYAGDAPLAERRAQALSVDHEQLRLLLGEPELRELLDPGVIRDLEQQLQHVADAWPVEGPDELHDLLVRLGDLDDTALAERVNRGELGEWLIDLERSGQALVVVIAGARRWIAAEDAARYRDALGVALPADLPRAFLEPVRDPLADLVLRYAKTHGPFAADAVASRYGAADTEVLAALHQLERARLVVRGAFLPEGQGLEWCSSAVLRRLKELSLASVRRQIEPVEPRVYARFLAEWQLLEQPETGLDGVLTVMERLQGIELPYSVWIHEVLPRRLHDFTPHDLDELCAAGELMWRGSGPSTGECRVLFYLTDDYPYLAAHPEPVPGELAESLRRLFRDRGALVFPDLVRELGLFHAEVFGALWAMVGAGEVSNDSLRPLASLLGERGLPARQGTSSRQQFRSRRRTEDRALARPGTEGRWSLLPPTTRATSTERARAQAEQLVRRFGVLTREAVRSAGQSGGFSSVYPVLKALEDAGKLRRGYFIQGLGATQFAAPGAESRLRRQREAPSANRPFWLAASDPANPYGASLPWPEHPSIRPSRAAGSHVVLQAGELLLYAGRATGSLGLFPGAFASPAEFPAPALADTVTAAFDASGERAWLIEEIDGRSIPEVLAGAEAEDPAPGTLLAAALCTALMARGFTRTSKGLQKRRYPGAVFGRRA